METMAVSQTQLELRMFKGLTSAVARAAWVCIRYRWGDCPILYALESVEFRVALALRRRALELAEE